MPARDTKLSSGFYNPSREPEDIREPACIWELLRRNQEFQTDAKLWTETWHEREKLARDFAAMDESKKNGPAGKANHDARVALTDQLFAIRHAALSHVSWSPVSLKAPAESQTAEDADQQRENEELLRARGWIRAEYIHCALKWMLPATLAIARREVRRPRGAPGTPEIYHPQLPAKVLRNHKPLLLTQPWPQTSRHFRRQFAAACSPKRPADKLHEYDLHDLGMRLVRVIERIRPGDQHAPRNTVQELKDIKQDLYGIAIGELPTIANRYHTFLFPSVGVQPRSVVQAYLKEVSDKILQYNDKAFRGGFLGSEKQWQDYLIAERLPKKEGHLDYYQTAKILQQEKLQKTGEDHTVSKLAKNMEKDVRERCEAIEFWVGRVYPFVGLEPYISRKTRKAREKAGG